LPPLKGKSPKYDELGEEKGPVGRDFTEGGEVKEAKSGFPSRKEITITKRKKLGKD